MILLAHMLLGAVVGYKIENIPLAIILALLCHYFLDLFPHIEYSVNHIKDKSWKAALPDFLKVFLDFLLGILIISIFSKNQAMIYICTLVAIIPDGLTLISSTFPNKILSAHSQFHEVWVHYLTKQKKFPIFWKIFTQVAAVATCIILLTLN